MALSDESAGPEPPPGAGVDDIRADIDDTRDALAQTVTSLAEKLDVKARAGQKVARMKEGVRRHPALVAAAVTATVALPVVSRRRHQKG